MFIYESIVVKQDNGMFLAAILKINHDEPNSDTVKEFETANREEAMIWADDELSRITTGKGIWE